MRKTEKGKVCLHEYEPLLYHTRKKEVLQETFSFFLLIFMTVTKCVIPAAGFGTRFLPLTKAQPKEMLPIVDKPAIQYLVEEAVASGIQDIVIITGRGKRSIEDHFDTSYELETELEKKGKYKELEIVQNISRLANIAYVRQPIPRGDGDAVLRAKSFLGNEPFLVLFGDDIVRGPKPCGLQLIEEFERRNAPIIAVRNVQDHEVSSYGIIEGLSQESRIVEVDRILEKPTLDQTNSRLGVVGKYVLTPEIFTYLEALQGKE